MLYSKFIISILSFFGGAGIISFIDAHEARRQHQKDITVKEIRIFTSKLRELNTQFTNCIYHSKNVNAQWTLIKIMSYISSWSVNVKFHRIDVKMFRYSSRTLLNRENKMLRKIINVCLSNKVNQYYDIAKRANKFFKLCDII